MEGIEESYQENYLNSQLQKYLGKRVRVWAAGRQRSWKGVLLQVGLDFIEIGDAKNETAMNRKYLPLNQLVMIEPQK